MNVTWRLPVSLFLMVLSYDLVLSQGRCKIGPSIDTILVKNRSLFVGCAFAYVCPSATVHEKCVGFSDKGEKRLFTDTTQMEVASISKLIVGIALEKAVEMGLVSLDSPVNKYLPFEVKNFYFPGETITVRQVASHTAAFKDSPRFYWETFQNTSARNPRMTLGEFVHNFLSPQGLCYSRRSFTGEKPGHASKYCNLDASVIALVIEHASGMSFPEFSKRYVFDPIGMHRSAWLYSEVNPATLSRLYTRNGVLLRKYTIVSYPSSTLKTTLDDLVKLAQFAINNGCSEGRQVLSPQMFDEMLSVQPHAGRYGLFWIHYGNWVGHTGSNLGITTRICVNAERKTAYILLFNKTLTKRGTAMKNRIIDVLQAD